MTNSLPNFSQVARLCVVLFLALISGPLLAQGPGASLRITAKLGYDGFYRPETWTPIFVEVTNPAGAEAGADADFFGQLMVTSSPLNSSTRVSFTLPIDAPRASSKRFVLYARFPDVQPDELNTTLLLNAENGRTIQRIPLSGTVIRRHETHVSLLTDRVVSIVFPFVPESPQPIRLSRLSPTHLPDQWAGLAGIDVIVVPEIEIDLLEGPERQALLDYVRMGGRLIFLGGEATQQLATSSFAELLPVSLTGVELITREANGWAIRQALGSHDGSGILLSRAEPFNGTNIRSMIAGRPLVTDHTVGLGRVAFVATDLSRASATALAEELGVIAGLFPTRDVLHPQNERPLLIPRLQGITDFEASPPNVFLLILLAIVYAVVVGPLNFYLLIRFGRIDYAWFTLPVLIVVFLVLMVGVGRVTRTMTNLVREVRIETYRAGDSHGRAEKVIQTFTSTPGTIRLDAETQGHVIGDSFRWQTIEPIAEEQSGFVGFAGAFLGDSRAVSPTIRVAEVGVAGSARRPVEGRPLGIRQWSAGAFDAASFHSKGPVHMNGKIISDLRWTTTGLAGSITNNSDRHFSTAYLFVGVATARLGELRPGEMIQIDEFGPIGSFARAIPDATAIPSRWLSAFPIIPDDTTDAEQLSLSTLMRLIQQDFQPESTRGILAAGRNEITLVGIEEFLEETAITTSLSVDRSGTRRATVVHLTAIPEDERMTFPPEVVQVSIVRTRTTAILSSLFFEGNGIRASDAQVFFSVEIPSLPANWVIDRIRVDATTGSATGATASYRIFRQPNRAGWVSIAPAIAMGSEIPMEGVIYPGDQRFFLEFETQTQGIAQARATSTTTIPAVHVTVRRID